VACGSWSPDLHGRFWRTLASFFLTVQLWWRELWHGRRQELGISDNKAILSFFWRLCVLARHHSARQSLDRLFVKLPWWRRGTQSRSNEAFFFNKWCVFFLWLWSSLLMLSLLAGHGDRKKCKLLVAVCSKGGFGGKSLKLELIYAGGILASGILCRQGGESSTSNTEAFQTS
jgi:hypothetical protein